VLQAISTVDAAKDGEESTLANLLHFGRFWLIYYEQRERVSHMIRGPQGCNVVGRVDACCILHVHPPVASPSSSLNQSPLSSLQDKLSLELGSTFKHAEWTALIEDLLAPHTHPRSLRRFMKPADRARFFQGDVSPAGEKLSLLNAKPSSSDMHEVRMFRTS
jgi:hypothetical protein